MLRILIVASLFWTSPAFAKRYLVLVDKNSQTQQQLKKMKALAEMPMSYISLSDRSQADQVVQVLPHVSGLVVEAEQNPTMHLQDRFGSVSVEEEVFHPLPIPVNVQQLFAKRAMGSLFSGALDTDEQPCPYGIKMVRAQQAWAAGRTKGEGAKVLVLDTGLDRDHPAIQKNFVEGTDFIRDDNAPYAYFDRVGHGTHVAATILANEAASGFTGVAPEASLYVGRVCADEGCSSIALVEGIEWAIAHKMDVINMSLGGETTTQGERSAISKADVAGVVIVAATGNNGKAKVSYPAALPTVVAVGAVDEGGKRGDFSQYGPEIDVVAPGVEVVSAVPQGTGVVSNLDVSVRGRTENIRSMPFIGSKVEEGGVRTELAYAGLGKLNEFQPSMRGKVVLIDRGEISFATKIKNALANEAAGVIVLNNEPGMFSAAVNESGDEISIPAILIPQAEGERLKAAVKTGRQQVSVDLTTVRSDFLSYSGTSMATPHVAGVVALIRAANPHLTTSEVREILTATATSVGPVREYGAGLVNAEKAVTSALKAR